MEEKLSDYHDQTEQVELTKNAGEDVTNENNQDDEENIDYNLYRGPKEIIYVAVQMFFSRTADLDMVMQNYYTQFDLVLEWRPTKSEVDAYINDPINFTPEWIPIVQFKNGNIAAMNIKKIKENNGYRVIGPKCEDTDVYGNTLKNLRYPYMIEAMWDVQGTFSEFLELHNFPMDVQDLQVSMQLMDSTLKATFVPYFNAKAEVVQVSEKYNGLMEYEMSEPVVEFYCNQYSEAFSALNIRLKIARKYFIYFWKIVVVVGLICFASIASYTMHREDDLPERYGLLFTLLLTQVAFQYVVSESLPNLTYLTLLDVYVLCGFGFLILQILMAGVISWFNVSEEADNWIGVTSIFIFGIWQVLFFAWAYKARQYELRKTTFNSYDYQINNYLQFKNAKKRNKCWGVTPGKLSFTKQARGFIKGDQWNDLSEGYEE